MKLGCRWLALGVRVAVVVAAGCSSSGGSTASKTSNASLVDPLAGSPGQGPVGSVEVEVTIVGNGADVNSLTWTISNSANTYSGDAPVTSEAAATAQSLNFVAGNIPTGSYTLTVTVSAEAAPHVSGARRRTA